MRVELIRPIVQAARSGPTNGMYALQRALRARMPEWLAIRDAPSGSRGSMPWFWSWRDRSVAAAWALSGRPFLQGPNLLFGNSRRPRRDETECTLLDGASCRAMFCHTAWYRDLIAQHRRPSNRSPIELWPYPIDPLPDGPLRVAYDLLIYDKSKGALEPLVKKLAAAFPRHRLIQYGSFAREELMEAARRSRACAYLTDNDHGPLALEEILLSGCPSVGVRTGASFVTPGTTGVIVDKLAYDEVLAGLHVAQKLDRSRVREHALSQFDAGKIVATLVKILDHVRR